MPASTSISDLNLPSTASAFLSVIFQSANEGMLITNAEGTILAVNPAFTTITGYSAAEVCGRNPRLLKSGEHDEAFYRDMWEELTKKGTWAGVVWSRRANKDVYPEYLTLTEIRGSTDSLIYYVGIFSDISAEVATKDKLQRALSHDPLTQLPNVALLLTRLEQTIAAASERNTLVAVCYMDIDKFSSVNEKYGIEIGNRVLIEVAQRLHAVLREGDLVSRISGNQFALMMCDFTSMDGCRTGIQRLLQTMEAPILIDAMPPILLTASLGVTVAPYDEAMPNTLLRHADHAMHAAKQLGRNQYSLFDPVTDRVSLRNIEKARAVEDALRQDELRLFYQPKVNLRTGEILGVEALIRWLHPTHGMLSPIDFIPYIEHTETAIRVGEWVLENALSQLDEWRKLGLHLPISVNISGPHLQHKLFVPRLKALLARYPDIPSCALEIEILESAALSDIIEVSAVIEECAALGVTFSIDDFGTGYSSFTYLKHLPTSALKIDRSFVQSILNNSGDLSIVQGVIHLAEAFGRIVIAEGIETLDHATRLLEIGCEWGQGFGIAIPMSEQAIPLWVETWRAAHTLANATEDGSRLPPFAYSASS
ncbi:MAG: bifunctional diguanylate cyclase/phosphodiesterase [Sulfuritalea sp.]|nr:bifunctional diguanylate cyclase/phosphodiesterase [Sulfuritalea sp.]